MIRKEKTNLSVVKVLGIIISVSTIFFFTNSYVFALNKITDNHESNQFLIIPNTILSISQSSIEQFLGTDNNDTLIGSDKNELIEGLDGDDNIAGGEGDDFIEAGDGDDLSISGNDGNDYIVGGKGNDVLSGNDGNDTIIGSEGNDILAGGRGSDQFECEGDDTITDFNESEGDKKSQDCH